MKRRAIGRGVADAIGLVTNPPWMSAALRNFRVTSTGTRRITSEGKTRIVIRE